MGLKGSKPNTPAPSWKSYIDPLGDQTVPNGEDCVESFGKSPLQLTDERSPRFSSSSDFSNASYEAGSDVLKIAPSVSSESSGSLNGDSVATSTRGSSLATEENGCDFISDQIAVLGQAVSYLSINDPSDSTESDLECEEDQLIITDCESSYHERPYSAAGRLLELSDALLLQSSLSKPSAHESDYDGSRTRDASVDNDGNGMSSSHKGTNSRSGGKTVKGRFIPESRGAKSNGQSQRPPAVQKPLVKAFYVPRENSIPSTKDATLTSWLRIRQVKESKLRCNVRSGKASLVEPVWWSFRHLNDVSQWQKLLAFGDPLLMNFKLIALKSSFENIIVNTSDFVTFSAILEVLGEITRSKFEAHKLELFKGLATPHFIHSLSSIIGNCRITRPKEALLERFIENLVDIYGDIFLQLDSIASDDLAVGLEGVLENCKTLFDDEHNSTVLLNQLSAIIKSRHTLIRANSCFPFNVLKEESVESNIIYGPYDDVDHYLSVQYRLLKEDFQNSLRAGIIEHIKSSLKMKHRQINYHLNAFKNVTLIPYLTTHQIKYKIQFHDRYVLSKIRDPNCPNFFTGSILLLTNTNFKDYVIVRVEDRSPLERDLNFIYVSVVLGPPGIPQMIAYKVMVEPTLFEPYYRVLNSIRSINAHNFPFSRYIVKVNTDVLPPAYLRATDTVLKIDGFTCSLWKNDTWPSPEKVGLNPAQLDGLKQALRNEIAIIQGPPGTGKTFLSRKVIEVLLQNKSLWHKGGDDGAALIVVICLKNQSLDQLLTGLLRNKVEVLRVGCQSKEEMLDAYNLKTLKKPTCSSIYGHMRWLASEDQKNVIANVKQSLEILDGIHTCFGIIKLEHFSHLLHLSKENVDYLEANLEKWLLDIPCNERDINDVESVVNEVGRKYSTQSSIYEVTLREVNYTLERVKAGLNMQKELENSDKVDLLTKAEFYLEKKMTLMEDHMYKLKGALTRQEKLKLENLKKEFGSDDQGMLKELPVDQRWLLYKWWLEDLDHYHQRRLDFLVAESSSINQRQIEVEELMNMLKIAQCNAQVVGLTTTAAAKYFKIMECLKPKIVLVEEAAEVMEAHTIASLSKYCEHLILVGDHKQLRPLTSSYIIGRDAHLDYSLYERLVNNGFKPCTLDTQYRMRPDIADLIRPAVYKQLYDAPSVASYPQVLGVDANVFFVDHTMWEDSTPNFASRWNKHEAEFHLALCNYLILQGYQPSQITILATYSEQEKYFNQEKMKYRQLSDVLMASVDSYQGKENDIILLSLVRSNKEDVIGFLAQSNRINVALSRARIGLFITGNKSNLLAKQGLWTDVIEVLGKKKAIGDRLPLKCQIHGTISFVARPLDIKNLKNGGCLKQCKVLLPCGHKCTYLCHPLDREHNKQYTCPQRCRKLADCSHPCALLCHTTNSSVSKCFCSRCSSLEKCGAPLLCGHTCQLQTHDADMKHRTSHLCSAICNTTLPCGHVCKSFCHNEDPEHRVLYKCQVECDGLLLCGHKCLISSKHGCSKHGQCFRVCKQVLSCGHKCPLSCHYLASEHAKCGLCVTKSPKGGSPSVESSSATSDKTIKASSSAAVPTGHSRDANCLQVNFGDNLRCNPDQPMPNQSESSVSKLSLVASDRPVNGSANSGTLPVNSAHGCEILKNNRKCLKLCKALLSCQHLCLNLCHHRTPHTDNDVCGTCSHSKHLTSKLSSLEIRDPLLEHCCHFNRFNQCVRPCNRWLCGHTCSLNGKVHNCSDHSDNAMCQKPCEVRLSCNHKCSKSCHLFDNHHKCHKECPNSSQHASEEYTSEHPERHSARSPDNFILMEVPVGHKHAIHGCYKKCGAQAPCGHKCFLKCHNETDPDNHKICKANCPAKLSCGHLCNKKCHLHEKFPHFGDERCKVCCLDDILRQTCLSFGSVEPLDVCCHMQRVKSCDGICEGRPCGHPCSLSSAKHKCSDHEGISKDNCEQRCAVELPGKYACQKTCHVGDPGHLCKKGKVFAQRGNSLSNGLPQGDCLKVPPVRSMCSASASDKANPISAQPTCPGTPAKDKQKLPRSGHQCRLLSPTFFKSCSRKCLLQMRCNHRCPLKCHNRDSPHVGSALCVYCHRMGLLEGTDPSITARYCLHMVDITTCSALCTHLLCGHRFLGSACKSRCYAILACGHKCVQPCDSRHVVHKCAGKKCKKKCVVNQP